MSANPMTKDKRNQIIGTILATLLVLGGLGFGLIKPQYENLQVLDRKKAEASEKLRGMDAAVKGAESTEAALAEISKTLAEKESTMATGDLYSWTINAIRRFKLGYKVEIPQFGPISPASDVSLMASFRYKQATLNVGGKAYYHDLGRFLAEFENQFPLMRVVNLTLDVDPAAVTTADREKLMFKMDVITLVKPGNP